MKKRSRAIPTPSPMKPTASVPGASLHGSKVGTKGRFVIHGKIVAHNAGEYGEGPTSRIEVHKVVPVRSRKK